MPRCATTAQKHREALRYVGHPEVQPLDVEVRHPVDIRHRAAHVMDEFRTCLAAPFPIRVPAPDIGRAYWPAPVRTRRTAARKPESRSRFHRDRRYAGRRPRRASRSTARFLSSLSSASSLSTHQISSRTAGLLRASSGNDGSSLRRTRIVEPSASSKSAPAPFSETASSPKSLWKRMDFSRSSTP